VDLVAAGGEGLAEGAIRAGVVVDDSTRGGPEGPRAWSVEAWSVGTEWGRAALQGRFQEGQG